MAKSNNHSDELDLSKVYRDIRYICSDWKMDMIDLRSNCKAKDGSHVIARDARIG